MRSGKIPARRLNRLGARTFTLIALLGALALVAAACGDSSEVTVVSIVEQPGATVTSVVTETETVTVTSIVEVAAPTTTQGIKGTIAFSFGNEASGIYPLVATPARLQAEKRGYDFIEGAANGDCDQQVADLENFIAQGVLGFAFLPLCGPDPYINVTQQAKDAGLYVVGYSTAVEGGDSALVYANIDGARSVMDIAIDWFNNEFTGDPATFSWGLFTFDQCGRACTDRTDPMRDIGTEAFGVAPVEAEAVAEDTGLEATETFLAADPGLNMVIGINDGGALGAYQAFVGQIEQGGRDPGEIFVGGMDGQNEALELIAGGDPYGIYRVSGAILIDQLGTAVADSVINLIEGQEVPSLLFLYAMITPDDPARAQEILDNYNALTGG